MVSAKYKVFFFFFHSNYFSVTFSLEQIIKAKMFSHNMFVMQWSRHGDSFPSFFFWDPCQVLSQKTLLY